MCQEKGPAKALLDEVGNGADANRDVCDLSWSLADARQSSKQAKLVAFRPELFQTLQHSVAGAW